MRAHMDYPGGAGGYRTGFLIGGTMTTPSSYYGGGSGGGYDGTVSAQAGLSGLGGKGGIQSASTPIDGVAYGDGGSGSGVAGVDSGAGKSGVLLIGGVV